MDLTSYPLLASFVVPLGIAASLLAALFLYSRFAPKKLSGPYTKLYPDYKGFTHPPSEGMDFDLRKVEEPKYRPFKFGAYQVSPT
jgi:hypothetical protein